MTPDRTDSALVAAHLGGDRAALGAIYDRYADRLFDTAVAMLRDRDEAADAVQEVFLVAASKLGQLRDPDRLKAWLFAVLRHEVYRRSRHRRRSRPTDFSLPGVAEMEAPSDPRAEAAEVERVELAELVRAAAAGLDERDQLVMELSLRQDLSGADLAAAVGVTTSQAHVLVHRMRDRLSRSLGAVTVARMGREDCDELAGILEGWDGTFSVLIRKRVARHVERCEVCDETRSRFSAAALFGAAPVLAAPADLRDAVLTAVSRGQEPRHDPHFDGDGFPRPPRRARVGEIARSRLAVTAAMILAVVAVIGIATFLGAGTDRSTTLTSAAGTTSTAETSTGPASTSTGPVSSSSGEDVTSSSSTSSGSTSSGSASSSTTGPSSSSTTDPSASTTDPSTTTGSTGTTVTPGDVVLSTSVIDLGESASSGTLTLSNPGGKAVDWSLTGGTGSPFAWATRSGTLAAGASTPVMVSVDRTGLPEGSLTASFTVSGGPSGSAPLQVRARVEHPPQITITRGPRSLSCPSSTRDIVVADVSDESPIASVELRWSGPGSPGGAAMTSIGPSTWEGDLAPEPLDGTWTYTVSATDSRGNTASVSRSVVVSGCSTTTTTGGFTT